MGRRDVVEAEPVIGFVVAVEDLGGQVEPVGPNDSACLRIDVNLSEECGVIERQEQRSVRLTGDVLDVTNDAIVEQQPHDGRSNHGNADDSRDWVA